MLLGATCLLLLLLLKEDVKGERGLSRGCAQLGPLLATPTHCLSSHRLDQVPEGWLWL